MYPDNRVSEQPICAMVLRRSHVRLSKDEDLAPTFKQQELFYSCNLLETSCKLKHLTYIITVWGIPRDPIFHLKFIDVPRMFRLAFCFVKGLYNCNQLCPVIC